MGFGQARDAKLRFVCSLNERVPRKNERILMHHTLLSAMGCEAQNIDVLAVNFGQKIRLGRMEIELFPAGLGPGSSQLKLSYRNRHIVYCGGIRLAKPLTSPPPEIPTCDVLLLDVTASAPKPGSPNRIAKELSDWLTTATKTNKTAVVLCDLKTAALDVLWVLKSHTARVYAAKPLYDLCRRLAGLLGRPNNLSRLEQTLPKEGILLLPEESWRKSKFFGSFTRDQVASVGAGTFSSEYASQLFRLGESEDRSGLAAYVKQTGATQVVLGQNCDEALLRVLKKDDLNVFRVTHPVQIPFPFLSRRQ